MTVEQWCAKYMDGMTPVPWQRVYIELLLGIRLVAVFDEQQQQWPNIMFTRGGKGGGKTTLRRAVIRWIEDLERQQ